MTYTEILHQQVEQLPSSYHAETSRYLEFLLQKTGMDKNSITEIDQEDNSQKILALITEMASRPNTFSQPGAMEEWEESRKDKVLFGREE